MKTAILQCADQGPVESLAVMLWSVGYRCLLPDEALLSFLRKIGCDTVLSPHDLTRSMGYEAPDSGLFSNAQPWNMESCDLYVDVKGHRNGPKVWERWPRLRGRTLWYRINGGKPEHVIRKCGACAGGGEVRVNKEGVRDFSSLKYTDQMISCPTCRGTGIGEDCGDEVNPPCPVLTPNQWYRQEDCPGDINWTRGNSYVCWPPFHRFGEYGPRDLMPIHPPICLVHNLEGWGGGPLIPSFRALGVKMYGRGSPDGIVPHAKVRHLVETALAYVHIKSSDAPGYALYEALAAGCPVICSRRLIWRCQMGELLIPGKTCLVFDRETHDPLTEQDVKDCTNEVRNNLKGLTDPTFNRQIGDAGRERLKEVMWSADRASDVEGLRAFMGRNFGD